VHISDKISGRSVTVLIAMKFRLSQQPLFLVDEIHTKGNINAICLVDKKKQVYLDSIIKF